MTLDHHNRHLHGGDAAATAKRLGLPPNSVIKLDFSVNLNPLGPPPKTRHILMRGMDLAAVYPEAYAETAARALAAAHDLPPRQALMANGATEAFGWILQAFKPLSAALLQPCYAGYREACEAHRVETINASPPFNPDHPPVYTLEALTTAAGDALFIGNPNNPTGHLTDRQVILRAAQEQAERLFVIDESFMDFVKDSSQYSLVAPDLPPNILVVKSLTKFFAVPGLRLGMVCGHPESIARLRHAQLPWSVNGLAQALAPTLYSNAEFLDQTRNRTAELRRWFTDQLNEISAFMVTESAANFLLARLHGQTASGLQRALLRKGVLIRSCANFPGLGEDFIRLAVRPRRECEELLELLSGRAGAVFRRQSRSNEAKTPAIMVVGTTSNAGKSVVATGLCRLLARQGISVAPFKAQNMALNSYVTHEGGEMGRAQVVQAQAAGIVPHTDMNPILLKPLGEDGCQIIVNGHPVNQLKAREYYAMKDRLRAIAREAYDRLARRHEFILLEGAGSPAEINLANQDFVNMDMAEYAEARAILVADIDRGGVFASILGTISLLPSPHRKLLVGIVINKFRGDVTLLGSGISEIEAMTGVPVLGVLSFIPDLHIEEEDSLGLEKRRETSATVLDVAIICLPRISNFTDFMAMEGDQGIAVRYVKSSNQLGDPDLIIIPGTKNTRADLQWLRQSGLTAALRLARKSDTPIIGVCGGLQMLGKYVRDPQGAEGSPGSSDGLGLLPLETSMAVDKELAQVEGATTASFPFGKGAKLSFKGYEIHVGQTMDAAAAEAPLTITSRRGAAVREPAGTVSADGLVFGTYVHGFFDNRELRNALWEWLCQRKNISADGVNATAYSANNEFDRLADLLEDSLHLETLGIGKVGK